MNMSGPFHGRNIPNLSGTTPSPEGLSLPLILEWGSIEREVNTVCRRVFEAKYPLSRDDAENLISGSSASQAMQKLRAVIAPVMRRYMGGDSVPDAAVKEAILELEEFMSSKLGITCDLPGHSPRA
jgi:hypothetical protein